MYRLLYSKDVHRTKCQETIIARLTHSPYTKNIASIRRYTNRPYMYAPAPPSAQLRILLIKHTQGHAPGRSIAVPKVCVKHWHVGGRRETGV